MRFLSFKFGRGGEIRTHGLLYPNNAKILFNTIN
nr:MAG TPA_asm: hypothetical protein [Caudoviricetes sp.]